MHQSNYRTGLARLADPEDDHLLPIAFGTEYRLTAGSGYDAIMQDSKQVRLISAYEKEVGLRVHYQLYNSWTVPFVQQVPLAEYTPPDGSPDLGVRDPSIGAARTPRRRSDP